MSSQVDGPNGELLTEAEAVAFEDSLNGLVAAKRAGLHCVVIPNALTQQLDLTEADLRLGTLEQMRLADLLCSLE